MRLLPQDSPSDAPTASCGNLSTQHHASGSHAVVSMAASNPSDHEQVSASSLTMDAATASPGVLSREIAGHQSVADLRGQRGQGTSSQAWWEAPACEAAAGLTPCMHMCRFGGPAACASQGAPFSQSLLPRGGALRPARGPDLKPKEGSGSFRRAVQGGRTLVRGWSEALLSPLSAISNSSTQTEKRGQAYAVLAYSSGPSHATRAPETTTNASGPIS